MRYAIITETYPPEVNGVALTVQSMEQGLRARNHDVNLIRPQQPRDKLSNPRQQPHELLVAGLPLPRYPGLRFGLPAARTLAAAWKRQRPDAIYVATEGPLGWSALRTANRMGIPAATGFHTRFDEYMRDYGAPFLQSTALRWMRHFHNMADATLVPTMELQTLLSKQRFRNVLRLSRAVDTQLFNPLRRDSALRASWGLKDDSLAVIYLGRIAPEKNLSLAIRAFRALQKYVPEACFVWVGDGPARERIEQQNPDFIFCGLQRGESLARHFASADLFLFPSRSETYGNVTLEAMASGVPTIAFDYGAARERLRDGEHGAAIGNDQDDDFIAATVRIGRDAPLRAQMRIAARDAVSTLRPQDVAADFDAILQTLAFARKHDERHGIASTAARERS